MAVNNLFIYREPPKILAYAARSIIRLQCSENNIDEFVILKNSNEEKYVTVVWKGEITIYQLDFKTFKELTDTGVL